MKCINSLGDVELVSMQIEIEAKVPYREGQNVKVELVSNSPHATPPSLCACFLLLLSFEELQEDTS